MKITQKSIPVLIILSIVTCGIYYLYWIYNTSSEIQAETLNSDVSPALELVFSLFCGIYQIYWMYKYSKKIVEMYARRGVQTSDNSIVALILSIFGLSIVSAAILQSQLNTYVDTFGGPVQQ